MNYYNEFDRRTAAWLRELISAGLIPAGDVDERSICDVKPNELDGYIQCHFFAGISGWSRALQLAGWPADRPVWTGSCPCQPFSCAGKGEGKADARHLWPEFARLIRVCRPPVVFGEQVESAVRHGWLDGVFSDMEEAGYTCGAVVLGAHSVGAPHIRQRLYWVANAGGAGCEGQDGASIAGGTTGEGAREVDTGGSRGSVWRQVQFAGDWVADTDGGNTGAERKQRSGEQRQLSKNCWSDSRIILCRDGKSRRIPQPKSTKSIFQFTSDGIPDIMGLGWNSLVSEIKERMICHAQKTKTGPKEALRTMWLFYESESLRRNTGGHDAVQVSEILLVALCELSRYSRDEFNITASDICEIQERTMRALWGQESPACPPQEQGLEGPQTGEPGNALHSVPPAGSERRASKAEVEVLRVRSGLEKQSDVPETSPEMEEVWRSFENKGSETRNAERIQNGIRVLKSLDCFPLADGLPGRVGMLRGAGNAIVPQVAAEFIRAYME